MGYFQLFQNDRHRGPPRLPPAPKMSPLCLFLLLCCTVHAHPREDDYLPSPTTLLLSIQLAGPPVPRSFPPPSASNSTLSTSKENAQAFKKWSNWLWKIAVWCEFMNYYYYYLWTLKISTQISTCALFYASVFSRNLISNPSFMKSAQGLRWFNHHLIHNIYYYTYMFFIVSSAWAFTIIGICRYNITRLELCIPLMLINVARPEENQSAKTDLGVASVLPLTLQTPWSGFESNRTLFRQFSVYKISHLWGCHIMRKKE